MHRVSYSIVVQITILFTLLMSHPSTHHVRFQADCPKKTGHSALAGLHRALRVIEQRRKEQEKADVAGPSSVGEAAAQVNVSPQEAAKNRKIRDARTLVSATLNNSVNHLVVMSPMAA
jgi:hypothetical protein